MRTYLKSSWRCNHLQCDYKENARCYSVHEKIEDWSDECTGHGLKKSPKARKRQGWMHNIHLNRNCNFHFFPPPPVTYRNKNTSARYTTWNFPHLTYPLFFQIVYEIFFSHQSSTPKPKCKYLWRTIDIPQIVSSRAILLVR